MTDRPIRHYDLDPARQAALADGWLVGVCLDQDGAESLWLVSPTPDAEAGCACGICAPHEQDRRPGPEARRLPARPTEQA